VTLLLNEKKRTLGASKSRDIKKEVNTPLQGFGAKECKKGEDDTNIVPGARRRRGKAETEKENFVYAKIEKRGRKGGRLDGKCALITGHAVIWENSRRNRVRDAIVISVPTEGRGRARRKAARIERQKIPIDRDR